MKDKINRVGEEGINTFGSKTIIVGYRMNRDIDVYFPEYNWTAKSVEYQQFKKGKIKCPYERRYYDVGYIGEGKYKVLKNGKTTKCYDTWHSMIQRCYDHKLHEKIQHIKIVKFVKNGIISKISQSGIIIIIMR